MSEEQLIILDKVTAAELFDASTGKMEALLADLKKNALAEVMDGSTPEGRIHCTRHKNKVVAVQKVFDELKKSQTKHLKEEAKRIDSLGKKANDLCEELKAAIMKPRVEWEEKESVRVKGHNEAIAFINSLQERPAMDDVKGQFEQIKDRIARFELIAEPGEEFEEFEEGAKQAYESTAVFLKHAHKTLSDQIEKEERLAELEAKEAKRLKEAEEERLRLEGEERAKAKLLERQEAEKLKAIRESAETMDANPVPVENRKILEEGPAIEESPMVPELVDNAKRVKNALFKELTKFYIEDPEKAKAFIIAIDNGEIPQLAICYDLEQPTGYTASQAKAEGVPVNQ